jgi:hypothetical protein
VSPTTTNKKSGPSSNSTRPDITRKATSVMTKVQDTTVSAPAIDVLLAELGEPGLTGTAGYRILEPDDPFYKEPVDEIVKHVSELKPERAKAIIDGFADDPDYFESVFFADSYTRTGERVENPDEIHGGDRFGPGFWVTASRTPNAVVYLEAEDLIFVSRGQFIPIGVDGETITFLSEAEQLRRWRAEEDAALEPYLDAIRAAAPEWTDPITSRDVSDGETEDELDIVYSGPNRIRSGIGSAYITQCATFNKVTNEVTLRQRETVLRVDEIGTDALTPLQVRELATDLLTFADDIEKHL